MTTYAVLQKLPPEAFDEDEWRYGAVDVLTVGTQLSAEAFLTDYRRRHQAACQEWRAWDVDKSRELDSTTPPPQPAAPPSAPKMISTLKK
jgi:hypothetical protein